MLAQGSGQRWNREHPVSQRYLREPVGGPRRERSGRRDAVRQRNERRESARPVLNGRGCLEPPAPSVGPRRQGRKELLPDPRRVEAAQPLARVGRAVQGPHEPAIARMAHPRVEEAVDEGGPQQPSEALLPEPVVLPGMSAGESTGGQVPGEERVANAESPEGVLKTGGFAREKGSAAKGASGREDLTRSSEEPRVSHLQPRALLEEPDGSVEIPLLAVEVREDAGGDRAEAAVDQQVRVPLRSQFVGEDAEDAVAHVRVEHVAGGHRRASARSVRDDLRMVARAGALAQADLDAAGERLLFQCRVERLGTAATPDEIEERVRRAKVEFAPGGIEEETFAERGALEARFDAERGELLEDVAAGRPVLDPLVVAVEAPADVPAHLANDRRHARAGERAGRGDGGGARAGDQDRCSAGASRREKHRAV